MCVLTFAAGHIGASLIIAGGIDWALQRDLLPVKLADTVDVGPSYGLWAVAALFTYCFSQWWQRLCWATAIAALLTVTAWQRQTFTDYGHLTAMLIGFGLYPLSRRPNTRRATANTVPLNRAPTRG